MSNVGVCLYAVNLNLLETQGVQKLCSTFSFRSLYLTQMTFTNTRVSRVLKNTNNSNSNSTNNLKQGEDEKTTICSKEHLDCSIFYLYGQGPLRQISWKGKVIC